MNLGRRRDTTRQIEASAAPSRTDGPTRQANQPSVWKASVWASRLIRWTVMLLPSVLSFFVTWSFARRLPPGEVDVSIVTWWICLFAVGVVVLMATERVARGLLPLAALFKLSLVFPDEAPSRYGIALRTNSTKKLAKRVEEIRVNGFPTEESEYAETMLELVAGLSTHDRLTRGHSERVRAYTDMIAEELGLPEEDASKLRWAALLHDVGKIFVPSAILNKPGKPTEAEWEVLKSHTWKGDELVEPLKEFLGEWSHTIRNHHDRWDGNGYPDGLAGINIPLGARIVAVADAYDVMTSARSYKEPRPAAEAREEIARCSGGQFDPEVARAFLNIGLGRLRFAAGPLSWLANIQAATRVPIASVVQPVAAVASAAVATFIAGAAPSAPAEIAFAEPPITTTTTQPATTQPTTTLPAPTTTVAPTTTTTPPPPREAPLASSGVISMAEDTSASVVLVASSPTDDVIFTILIGPAHGTLRTGSSALPARVASNGVEAFVTARFAPYANYAGPDSFSFEACNAAALSLCSSGVVAINVTPRNDPPQARADSAAVAEDGTLVLTPALVLGNDIDVDGDSMTVTWGAPTGVNTVLTGADLHYIPAPNSTSPGSVPYQACDATSCSAVAFVAVSVVPSDDTPVANPDTLYTVEDVPLALAASLVLGNDVEVDGDPIYVSWVPALGLDTSVEPPHYTPAADSNADAVLAYQLCDPYGCSPGAKVTLKIIPDDDIPVAVSALVVPPLLEDEPFTTTHAALLAHFSDIDGDSIGIEWGDLTSLPGVFADNGADIAHIPPADFNGSITLPYAVCSTSGLDVGACSAPASLVLHFAAVNDVPTIGGLPAAGPPHVYTHVGTESTTSSVTNTGLLALADDVETPGALTITYTDPNGVIDNGPDLIETPTGFDYTPQFASLDDVPFSYWICDADDCTRGIVNLTFTEVNDPPAPTILNIAATEDTSATITRAELVTAANDPDTASADLAFTFGTLNYPKGTITLNPTTGPLVDITFTPTPDDNGLQTINYNVCDNHTPTPNCQPGTIDITIAGTPDPAVITGAPSAKTTYDGVSVILLDDYTFTELDGETPWVNSTPQPSSAEGTAVVQPDNSVLFSPTPGFVGQTSVDFELCNSSGCVTDPTFSHWDVTVLSPDPPSIAAIPDQNANVGVAMSAGPFPVANPNSKTLVYTHTLPAGLSLTEGADEITIVGTVTDPSLLGTTASYDITVDDSLQNTTQTVRITFGIQGLSPHEGEVIFTEVLVDNMNWCDDELGFDLCVVAEMIELYNRGGSAHDMSGWRVQSHMPSAGQGVADLGIDIGPDSTTLGGVTLWPTTIVPGSYVGLNTRWLDGGALPSNNTNLGRNKDKLWLLDENGLVVDYVAWFGAGHLLHNHSVDLLPDVALGIWDSAAVPEMVENSGTYSVGQYTSLSLATLSNANTAACWEFTTSGNATSGGVTCSEPDVFLTTATPLVTPNHGDPMAISHGVGNYL